MSRFETTFRTAIANAERDVLVDHIRANPHMSLNELGKLATGELGNLLKNITVADLVRVASSGSSNSSSNKGASAASGSGRGAKTSAAAPREESGRKVRAEAPGRKPKAAVSQAEVDTRTAEGRAAYDQAVLEALRAASGPQSASNLTAVAGGSPLQIRTALARLIETGGVAWSGRARGTRYTSA